MNRKDSKFRQAFFSHISAHFGALEEVLKKKGSFLFWKEGAEAIAFGEYPYTRPKRSDRVWQLEDDCRELFGENFEMDESWAAEINACIGWDRPHYVVVFPIQRGQNLSEIFDVAEINVERGVWTHSLLYVWQAFTWRGNPEGQPAFGGISSSLENALEAADITIRASWEDPERFSDPKGLVEKTMKVN